MIFIQAIIGIISGFVSGLFASGGGLIVVPSLMYIFKQDAVKARATSILIILPMVITSGIFYGANNYINWNIGIKCAVGGILRRIYWGKVIKKSTRKAFKNFIYMFFNICFYKNDKVNLGETNANNINWINFWNVYWNRNAEEEQF